MTRQTHGNSAAVRQRNTASASLRRNQHPAKPRSAEAWSTSTSAARQRLLPAATSAQAGRQSCGRQRGDDAKEKDRRIQSDIPGAGKIQGGDEGLDDPVCEQHPANAGRQRHQRALNRHLAKEPGASGAERFSKRKITPASRQVADGQADGIHAGDQQNQ